MQTFLKWLAGTAMLSAATLSVQAEQYPERAINIVVPFSAGGVTDVIGRTVGEKMSKQMGQPVLVENKPGAGGNIGAAFVAGSKPDGYTLLMLIDAGTIAPALYPKLNYDPIRSFAPITMLGTGAHLVVAHPSFGPSNLQQLISAAKANPNTIFFASSGTGTSQHLGMERLKTATGMQIQHVPYKGGGEAINALVAGQVPFGMIGIAPALPHIRAGTLKALAIASARRSALLPDVPTVSESGVPGFESFNWFALVAPAGTPSAITERIHAEASKAMRGPGMADRLAALGVEVTLSDKPADLTRFIREDIVKWPPIVKASNIKVE